MLKELRISNFRLFDDEVTLRFRPITVLIGRNNSGKSSIIKFLLMLQQSLGGGSLGVLAIPIYYNLKETECVLALLKISKIR